jgi:hypothetical protein
MKNRLKKLEENPEFYKYSHDNQREMMSYIKVGDDYFISTGKHRTVIARFLEHFNPLYLGNHRSISDVSIEWKTIDYEFMRKRDEIYEIQEQYPDLTFDVTHTTDDDGLALTIHPHGSEKKESFTRAELRDVIDALKTPSLIKKLSDDKMHRLIPFTKCLQSMIS